MQSSARGKGVEFKSEYIGVSLMQENPVESGADVQSYELSTPPDSAKALLHVVLQMEQSRKYTIMLGEPRERGIEVTIVMPCMMNIRAKQAVNLIGSMLTATAKD